MVKVKSAGPGLAGGAMWWIASPAALNPVSATGSSLIVAITLSVPTEIAAHLP